MNLYALYPNISHLTFEWSPVLHLSDYLRPSLKSLTLLLPLHLDFEDDSLFLRRECFTSVFEDLSNFLKSNSTQLVNLSIQLNPNVVLSIKIPNATLTHYDSDGPVYEDLETTIETEDFPTSHYLNLLKEEDKQFLQELIVPTLSSHIFKILCIPRGIVYDNLLPDAIRI